LVWQFQQFRKLDGIGQPTLRSTLQIQGPYAAPRLYVARQGGDNSGYSGIPMSSETPTQMVSFPCSTVEGPCSVTAPATEEPLPNPGAYCGNKTLDWKELLFGGLDGTYEPPQWVPVTGHYVQTPFYGIVKSFKPPGGDNPFSHEYRIEPCPVPTLEALLNETICSSDWNLDARGLPGYRRIQAGRSALHVEWEREFSRYFLVGWGDPHPGDLVFVSGRHIVDCGHEPFKTEIHPPSVVAFMRTLPYNGRSSTQANVWVNGFYSGDPVQFDIIPPPRPSPTATLGYVRADGGLYDVTLTPTTPEGNRVRLRFTASRRQNRITSLGEMKWATGRTYYGRWHVYWN
jgi:hypothetical protein